MVVIAIIAILAAILLPASRNSDKKAADADGLRMNNYVYQMYKGKYIGKGACDNTGEPQSRCTLIPISPNTAALQKFPQTYGSQYVHNERVSGTDTGYSTNMPDWNTAAKKRTDPPASTTLSCTPSQRVLLCDNPTTVAGTAQIAHLFVYNAKASDLGMPYLAHSGKINMLTWASGVVSADDGELTTQYYFPHFGQSNYKARCVLVEWYTPEAGTVLTNPQYQ